MSADAGSAWYWFGLGVLAVWRVAHLLHVEHGPWGLCARLRAVAPQFGLGDLFACFYCLSFWTAAPVAWWLASGWMNSLVAWLALSAGAILIEVRVIGPAFPPDPPNTAEKPDDLLR